MKRYWVMKMGMWFDFVNGWQPTVPDPLILPLAQIVLEENPGAVLVDGAA